MDNTQISGHTVTDMIYAGVSLSTMLLGWISWQNLHFSLQILATVVSIGAGAMVFINNYKQNRRNNGQSNRLP